MKLLDMLAKAHSANTVRHLMKDERSKTAVADAAHTKNRLLTANLCRQYLKFAEVEIED